MMKRREFLVTASLIPSMASWSPALGARVDESRILRHTSEPEGPNNSEPALQDLVKEWITPTSHFYVRSHAPAPRIDIRSFRVSIEGLVDKPQKLTVPEMKDRYTSETVTATLTCAGNRRSEFSKKVDGVPWQAGAIGNAHWGGVRLSQVLKSLGIKEGAKHVHFESIDEHDKKGKKIVFGGSIPLAKVMADSRSMPGALLCSEMNGSPLNPDHGYPLRAVVPGFIGARSVKWLKRIVISDKPSPNHYLANAYKLVTEGSAEELAAARPIQTYLTNSVICTPTQNAMVKAGQLVVRGYSLAEGKADCVIKKVELSTDGGKRWRTAKLLGDAKPYCWRLWEAAIPVDGSVAAIIVRATDSNGKTQPEMVPWNKKGYLFNSWHKSAIKVRS